MDKVKSVLEDMKRAAAEEHTATQALDAARAKVRSLTDAVVEAFLNEYESLPVDVRNKIRHRINTTKSHPVYEGDSA